MVMEQLCSISQWEAEWIKSKKLESDFWLHHLDLSYLEQVP